MLIAFANSLDPECQCADSFCKQLTVIYPEFQCADSFFQTVWTQSVSVLIALANNLDPECQCAYSFCKQFGSRVSVC